MTQNSPGNEGPQQPQQEPQQPEQPPAEGQPPSPGAEAQAGGEVPKDARTMGMLAHLLGIFTGFIGPLVIWLIKKDDQPFVNDQGKEALNWQITLLIGYIISSALTFVCIGFVLYAVVWILAVIYGIIGTMKANRGEWFRYPWSIKFIK